MQCSHAFKEMTGYLHGLAIIAISIFSGIQIYDLKSGSPNKYWVPLGIVVMMILRLPNVVCIAFNDPHGWYVFAGSLVALVVNSYITYLLITEKKK